MQVELFDIQQLSTDLSNARKHSQRNLAAIKSSLRRFGQQKPIIIDSANIVRAGNGTLEAAIELGWSEIAVVRSDLPPSELVAYAIADNRTAELAEWDDEILTRQLESFDDQELLESAGFNEEELAKLLDESESLSPEDRATADQEIGEVIYEVVISCENESQQKELFERLRREGLTCRVLTM